MKHLVLGVDIGGTNVKLGLTNSVGHILARSHFSTKTFMRDKPRLVKAIIDAAGKLLTDYKLQFKNLAGIGMGWPGLVDPYKGIIKFLPNIPGWEGTPIVRIFQKELGIKTYIENDVNLITMGEWCFGAGKGVKDLVCITLGTGVGGGLILDNRIYRGPGYAAGEIGHMPINEKGPACVCGGFGCFEQYVGNSVLQKKAARLFNRPRITIEEVYALADQGDNRALKFWEETAVHIGNALTGIVNVLNPRLIVIGGGVANNEKFLFKTITATIKKRAMKVQASMFKIVRGKLGDDAGIIGAQLLVLEKLY